MCLSGRRSPSRWRLRPERRRSYMRYTRMAPILLLLPACHGGGPGSVEPITSGIRDAQGADHGSAELRENDGRIMVRIRVRGMVPGTHGVHLHAVGQCDGPDFQTGGAHLNPTGKQHGVLNPQGPHLGDLPNLIVAGDGEGEAQDDVLGAEARAGLKSFLGTAGLTLIVHAQRDDQVTDPAGNSGARVACAAFKP